MNEHPSRGVDATAEPEGPDDGPRDAGAEEASLRNESPSSATAGEGRPRTSRTSGSASRGSSSAGAPRSESASSANGCSVIDDLERALAHATKDPASVLEGLGAILERAWSIMERFGYPRFGETGVPFDPARHEAVSTVEADDEHPPGTVVAITRAGYGAGDRILRPAGVVVTRPEA